MQICNYIKAESLPLSGDSQLLQTPRSFLEHGMVIKVASLDCLYGIIAVLCRLLIAGRKVTRPLAHILCPPCPAFLLHIGDRTREWRVSALTDHGRPILLFPPTPTANPTPETRARPTPPNKKSIPEQARERERLQSLPRRRKGNIGRDRNGPPPRQNRAPAPVTQDWLSSANR